MGGAFISVSSKTGTFKLGDLRGTGYKPESEGGDGAWGELIVQVLSTSGYPEVDEGTSLNKVYTWHDNSYEGTGWFDEYGSEQWDNEIEFPAGQGFYVQGGGYKLQSAGEVYVEPVVATTDPANGSLLFANPYPCQITLADMSGGGYKPESEGGDGAWGELIVQVLSTSGYPEVDESTGLNKVYTWHDNSYEGTGWFDEYGSEQWADTTAFPIAQGFYVQGGGYTLEFTYPNGL